MEFTSYQEYFRACFATAYSFLDAHKHVRTDEDWERVVADIKLHSDPLTRDLLLAAFKELRRECETNQEAHNG